MNRRTTPALLALAASLVWLLAVAPAAAPPAAVAATPLFGDYIQGFIEHWGNVFKKQNGVIMIALAVGAVSLLIITRGKWAK